MNMNKSLCLSKKRKMKSKIKGNLMFPCNPSYLGKGSEGTCCPLSHVKIELVS